MGYVESQDILLSQFTVRETLKLSAQLRQPQNLSRMEKNEYVEKVIGMLEMEAYSNAVVGVPSSGLSLEQRKKLTASGLSSGNLYWANQKSLGIAWY